MKEIFASKNMIVKIALILALIILIEFTINCRPVEASVASIGGTLLTPILKLVVALADSVMNILQSVLFKVEESFASIDLETGGFWGAVITWLVPAALIIGGIVFTVLTAGASAAVLAVITPILTGAIGTGVAWGTLSVGYYIITKKTLGKAAFGTEFTNASIILTPEAILSNKIDFFNINFFDEPNETDSLISVLRTIVGQAYRNIRDISILALLIVIIYIFIRRIMSTSPQQRNDLMQTLTNCFVGLCLILVIHFIMAISISLTDMISGAIITSTAEVIKTNASSSSDVANELDGKLNYDDTKQTKGYAYNIKSKEIYDEVKKNQNTTNQFANIQLSSEAETVTVVNRNFLEEARFKLQNRYVTDEDGTSATAEKWNAIGWSFVYIVLVIITVAFVLLYGKRVLIMAALTMFAPIVGVMYPLNKMHGEARAHSLSSWFRQYMGNLVMQPLHLFVYTILIGSAMSIAINNPIYVIIALMGILYVEKLLKQLIGLPDDTMGGLSSALRETTGALKQGTRMARSAVQTAGRAASGLARAGAGLAANAIEARDNDNGENTKIHKQPVTEQPQLTDGGKPQSPALEAHKDDANNAEALVPVSSNPGADLAYADNAGFEDEDSSKNRFTLPPHNPENGDEAEVLVYSGDGFDIYDNPERENPYAEELRTKEANAIDVDFEEINDDDNDSNNFALASNEIANTDFENDEDEIPYDQSDYRTIDNSSLDGEEGYSVINEEDDSFESRNNPIGLTASDDIMQDTFDAVQEANEDGFMDNTIVTGISPLIFNTESARVSVGPRKFGGEVNDSTSGDRRNLTNNSNIVTSRGNRTTNEGRVQQNRNLQPRRSSTSLDIPNMNNNDISTTYINSSNVARNSSGSSVTRANNTTTMRATHSARDSYRTTSTATNNSTSGNTENSSRNPRGVRTANHNISNDNRIRQEERKNAEAEAKAKAEEEAKTKAKEEAEARAKAEEEAKAKAKEEAKEKARRQAQQIRDTTNGTLDVAGGILDTAFNMVEGVLDTASSVATGDGMGAISNAANLATEPIRGAERIISGVNISTNNDKKEKATNNKDNREVNEIDSHAVHEAADNLGIQDVVARDLVEKYTRKNEQRNALGEFTKEVGVNNKNGGTLALAAMDCIMNKGGSKEALEKSLEQLKSNGKIDQKEINAAVKYMEKLKRL